LSLASGLIQEARYRSGGALSSELPRVTPGRHLGWAELGGLMQRSQGRAANRHIPHAPRLELFKMADGQVQQLPVSVWHRPPM